MKCKAGDYSIKVVLFDAVQDRALTSQAPQQLK